MIEKTLLQNKIAALRELPFFNLTDQHIAHLENYLLEFDGSLPEKLNPYNFARKSNLSNKEAVALFLFAVKAGILDFRWTEICPYCGGIHKRHPTINTLHRDHFHCTFCNIDINVELDEWIEVAFDINKHLVKKNKLPDSPVNRESYFRAFFSPNTSRHSDRLNHFLTRTVFHFVSIEPGERKEISLTPREGYDYRLLSLDIDANIFIPEVLKSTDTTSRIYDIEAEEGKFTHGSLDTIYTVETIFNILNKTGHKIGIVCMHSPKEVNEFDDLAMKDIKPFLKGKELLNNQLFRNLFNSDFVAPELSLSVKSVTVLFSDLKGSTAIYGRVGDLKAYQLVNKHFDILRNCVDKCNGSIVKTIGDAIMASFNTPIDGFKAAWEMNRAIIKFNKEAGLKEEIAVKIGLNEGQALAVNLNNIVDYFGQTVNIAARVQGLAGGDEIWISGSVYENEEVNKTLKELEKQQEVTITKNIALLKGVEEEQTVFKLTSNTGNDR